MDSILRIGDVFITPALGILSILLIAFYSLLGIFVLKKLSDKDEVVKDEEFETNNFLYQKLRHNNALQFYNLTNTFKERWLENKKSFYITYSNAEASSELCFTYSNK